jgi:hypothetical protein
MKPFRAATHCAAGALAALVLAGCAPVRVTSFVDTGIDFSRYRTYAWESTAAWTGDPRLDNNPFFHDYLKSAVDAQLLARRIERSSYGMADMAIRYHASTTQQLSVSDGEAGNRPCAECRLQVYDAGTIVIDIVDGRTNRLLWRGWAEGGIDGVIDSQTLMEQRIDEAVARILEKLPGALGRMLSVS